MDPAPCSAGEGPGAALQARSRCDHVPRPVYGAARGLLAVRALTLYSISSCGLAVWRTGGRTSGDVRSLLPR